MNIQSIRKQILERLGSKPFIDLSAADIARIGNAVPGGVKANTRFVISNSLPDSFTRKGALTKGAKSKMINVFKNYGLPGNITVGELISFLKGFNKPPKMVDELIETIALA